MKIFVFIISAILLLLISPKIDQESFEKDLIKTSTGDLEITSGNERKDGYAR